jgi:serine/threonine-protein kinase
VSYDGRGEELAVQDLSGRQLGRYRLTRLIGRGGMASVYEAHDPELDRVVAVKVLSSRLAEEPDFLGRFRHEARAIAALRHPAIVSVFDFGTADDLPYMVMEHVGGPSLHRLLLELADRPGDEATRLPVDAVVRLAAAMCSALDYAHGRGMVHRDVKPGNVLLTADLEPVVSDFGIARIAGMTSYTEPGVVMGTVHYMAPEQAQGLAVDHRCDIYSTGIVIYEALTGQVPFRGETSGAVLAQHITAAVPRAHDSRTELPDAVDGVLEKVLAKEPADRYETAGAFADALRRSLKVRPQRAAGALLRPDQAPQVLKAETIAGLKTRVEGSAVDIAAAVLAGEEPAGEEPAGEASAGEEPAGTCVPGLQAAAEPLAAEEPSRPAEPEQPEEPSRAGEPSAPAAAGAAGAGGRRAGASGWLHAHARPVLIGGGVAVVLAALIAIAAIVTRGDGGGGASPSPGAQNAQMEKLLGAAQKMLANGMLQQAIAKAQQAVKLDPNNPMALEQLGLTYMAMPEGDTKALELFQSAVDTGEANARAYALLASSQMDDAWEHKTGDYQTVVQNARLALDKDPNDALAHAVLARVAAAEDRRQDAISAAQESLITGSDDGLALSDIAWAYGVLGEWEDAVSYCEQAVLQEPKRPGLRLQLAEAYREVGRYSDALDAAHEGLELDQGYESDAHTEMAVTLNWQDKQSEAIAEYRQALDLDPDNDYASWGLGSVYFNQKDYEKALPYLERAVEDVPSNAGYQHWLGACYYKLERYEEALPHFERSVEEDPNDADFLAWEAWCYYQLGRYDEAYEAVSKALEIDPDVADGQELMDRLMAGD